MLPLNKLAGDDVCERVVMVLGTLNFTVCFPSKISGSNDILTVNDTWSLFLVNADNTTLLNALVVPAASVPVVKVVNLRVSINTFRASRVLALPVTSAVLPEKSYLTLDKVMTVAGVV